jgi:hypothetical protein
VSEIILREEIAKLADQDAQRYARDGRKKPNPFAPLTDAWAAYEAAFDRYYAIHTAPQDVDIDGGA